MATPTSQKPSATVKSSSDELAAMFQRETQPHPMQPSLPSSTPSSPAPPASLRKENANITPHKSTQVPAKREGQPVQPIIQTQLSPKEKIPSSQPLRASSSLKLQSAMHSASPSASPSMARKRKADKDIGWDNGEGFGAYMRHKNRKLREQFSAEYTSEGATSSALKGVVAWVDGYTRPTRMQLREILGRNGGSLETYFTPGRVTHIIAETLAAATRKRLKGMTKSSFKVVTPLWIVKSVEAGRILDERQFQVKGMKDPTNKSVADMFKTKRKRKA